MKKNRRGLGRGLEALIQNTSSEEEGVLAPVVTSEPAQIDPDTLESNESESTAGGSATVFVPHSGEPRGSRLDSLEPEVSSEEAEAVDTARASTSSDQPSSDRETNGGADRMDLTSRYLGGRGPDTARTTVPRETRRPVDVFFPDRRSPDGTDTTDSAQVSDESDAAAASRKAKARPTMPPVKPVSIGGKSAHAAPNERYASDGQPQSVEIKATATAPASVGGDPAPAQVRHHGSVGDAELRTIPTGDIHPNPRQPREVFDEDDMDELVASIAEVGVLQPIVVRPVEGPSPFELVMGERRWRASQRAGLTEIPAIVRHTADTDLLRDALLENLHRSQLNPLEEAAAYEQLLEDFNCTQEELSSRIGRSRPQITNTLRLLRLPPLVQRRVASGVLSAGHARALLALVDPAEMERLAQKVVSEGLSVRATEELVSLQDGVRQVKPKSRAPRSDRHERLDYLANSLTDRLDTTVKITLGARKGKIAIDFASVDDLNRIMDLIGQSRENEVSH